LFAETIGSKFASATVSGSVAILIALKALNIKEGDEVILPDYSFIAAYNCLRFLNITPVLCDISKDSLCLNTY
jgi:dTDP-4-amino-4,6-dideoxygalactose transaminase